MSKSQVVEAMRQMNITVTSELEDAIPESAVENPRVLWSRRYGTIK